MTVTPGLLLSFGGVIAPPVAPSLAVADNGNGTVVAIISGGNDAASNAVYVQSAANDLGTAAWVLAGTRTGKGNLTLTLTPGLYWARIESTLNSRTSHSNQVYFLCSNTTTSVQELVLLAIQARIIGLALAGVSSANVKLQKVPSTRKQDLPTVRYPAILVAPFGAEGASTTAGTNIRDDITYQVVVGFIAEDKQSQSDSLGVYLLWRERIRRAMTSGRFASVPAMVSLSCVPLDVVDPTAWFSDLFASALRVECTVREPRSIT